MLQSLVLPRARHDLATEQQQPQRRQGKRCSATKERYFHVKRFVRNKHNFCIILLHILSKDVYP